MARPFVYDWTQVKINLAEYIRETPDPQLKEFCLFDNSPSYDAINEFSKQDDELRQLVKKLLAKQEVFLSRAQGINPVMAIFRLKQSCHGYKDKTEVALDANITQTIKPIIQD